MNACALFEDALGGGAGAEVVRMPPRRVLHFHSPLQERGLCDGVALHFGVPWGDDPVGAAEEEEDAGECGELQPRRAYLRAQQLARPGELQALHRVRTLEILRTELVNRRGEPRYGEVNDRRVIYISPQLDCAGTPELVRQTARLCKLLLAWTHWQIRLVSQSALLPQLAEMLCDEVGLDGPWPVSETDLRERLIWGLSLSGIDDDLAAASGESAPPVAQRLASLHWLQGRGYRTCALLGPVLPQRDYAAFAQAVSASLHAQRCECLWAEVPVPRREVLRPLAQRLGRAGYAWKAEAVREISVDPAAWETYARKTFLALAEALPAPPGRLRFPVPVTEGTRGWWEGQRERGAVVLG